MILSNLIKISISNIKGNKYKTILMLSVITLFMILITCFFSFKNSFYSFLDRYLNSNFDFKLVQVEVGSQEPEIIMEKINKLNNKHISKIFKNNYEINVNTELNNMIVEINGNYDGFNYKITNGTDIHNKNDLVCPDYLGSGDWTTLHNIKQYENMNSKIGQILKLKFEQKYVVSNIEVKTLNSYEYDLQLVGVYDASDSLNGYAKCYVSKDLFDEILQKSKTIYSEKYKKEMSNYDQLPILVLVDDFKYVENVKSNIENLGFKTYIPEVDIDFYSVIFKVINIVTILIVIVSIVCMYNFIKSSLIESKRDIALFQIIGYDTKFIKFIYIIQYFILLFTSLIMSIIISKLFIVIATFILNKDPNFSVLNLHLYLIEVFIYFVIISITIYGIIQLLFNKLFKKNVPIELIRE